MKLLKIVVIVAFAYVGFVVAFESFFGFLQPTVGPILVITSFDRDGSPHDRVVSRLTSDGRLYIATNHWPRAWYKRALENPIVQVSLDGDKRDYRAVPVTGEEHDRIIGDHSMPLVFRFLSGFAPRYFLRLIPARTALEQRPAQIGVARSVWHWCAARRESTDPFQRSGYVLHT